MTRSARIEFRPVTEPITAPHTKFGGQPTWLEKSQWPLSRLLGTPMQFIGQIALDDVPNFPAGESGGPRLAYLFMTEYNEGDEHPDWDGQTFDPEGGENAVILQPSGRVSAPTVEQATDDKHALEEFDVRLTSQEEPEFRDEEHAWLGVIGSDVYSREGDNSVWERLRVDKLGGTPCFIQHVEYPAGGPWRPVLQLSDYPAPFGVNFGTGKGWIFVSEDGREGRFLWQC